MRKLAKRLFRCGQCEINFSSETEANFSEAKPGNYWYAAPGYFAKCPRCTGYAHEISYTADIKEESTMNVLKASCRGYTGKVVKLEEKESIPILNAIPGMTQTETCRYDLSIYNSEKQATYSFNGVKLEEIAFLGVEVHF